MRGHLIGKPHTDGLFPGRPPAPQKGTLVAADHGQRRGRGGVARGSLGLAGHGPRPALTPDMRVCNVPANGRMPASR